jgi:thiol-disulfide isomerase/thioredoxin
VVEAVYGGEFSKRSTDGRPIRYWIEQASGLVRRLTFTSGRPWTATVESAKLGQPPPDWLIQMAPRMAGRRNDKWAGREAPQFGEMSRMRGRVLVLNFWATWCGQCREEMPVIEKLRAEYRNRGVEVWGVTNEPPDKALRWMKNYGRSLPTLFGDNAFELYEVQSIPVTVVIDRKGLVQSYFVGLCGAADLRAAIDAALLN